MFDQLRQRNSKSRLTYQGVLRLPAALHFPYLIIGKIARLKELI